MRPHRVRLTTNLVTGYGLTDKMRLMRPEPRTREEIMQFHADGKELNLRFCTLLMLICEFIQTLCLYTRRS